eukprot:2764731-Rhodomonas_salina.1
MDDSKYGEGERGGRGLGRWGCVGVVCVGGGMLGVSTQGAGRWTPVVRKVRVCEGGRARRVKVRDAGRRLYARCGCVRVGVRGDARCVCVSESLCV